MRACPTRVAPIAMPFSLARPPCRHAIPLQKFVVRNDMGCGSTIGTKPPVFDRICLQMGKRCFGRCFGVRNRSENGFIFCVLSWPQRLYA